jgi:Na+-translocating ferredoxin:NAD+ oxidoreductase RNF subunit RnfB
MGLSTAPAPGAVRGRYSAPVRIEACQGCGACILTCPERAIRPAPHNPVVTADLCTGCGECVEICPADAISLAMPAITPAGAPSFHAFCDHKPGRFRHEDDWKA